MKHVRALVALAALVPLVALVGLVAALRSGPGPRSVPLSEAVAVLRSGDAASATLDDGRHRLTVRTKDGRHLASGYPEGFGADLGTELLARGVPLEATTSGGLDVVALAAVVAMAGLGAGLLWHQRRRGVGVAAFGKGRARPAEVPDTRFADVAGADEAVAELAEVAEFLHQPDRFQGSGARVPQGFLLCGPPGTGKTLLARAVAGEAGVPFFALSGSDFVETFVGVGAARVREVFERARKHGQAIVFIDEIDAVGKARGSGPASGASDEREATLNQLLVEMDGFNRSQVVVLAATNRPDTLDPALLRPGRFDRRITVPAPDRRGRTAILDLLLGRHRVHTAVDTVGLARRTPGLTGADLAFLVNEAALEAVRRGEQHITGDHLDRALATAVLGRERRSAVVTERDRRITAWHEAGHALCALECAHHPDPVQVTIVPRGAAGGVTWMGGTDDTLTTRREALDRLVVALGGRAAEEALLDGDHTGGAASDLAAATDLARAMVTEYGMSSLGVARITPEQLHQGRVGDAVADEVGRLLDDALGRARAITAGRRRVLDAVAEALLADETLHAEELHAIRARVQEG